MNTNDATRATDTALPKISRRRMLLGLAAASTATATVALSTATAATPDPVDDDESPELIEAWEKFRAAETEEREAKDALEWLADEWKHLWPLAPEEILGAARAEQYHAGNRERETDILGRPLLRDCSVLTKRLDKKFRQEVEKTCFAISTSDDLRESLIWLREKPVSGRTERSLARNQKVRADFIQKLEVRLHLAEQYEAETQRIRGMAGVDAAKTRVSIAVTAVETALDAVAKQPAKTLYGVRLKADTMVGYFERMSIRRSSPGFLGSSFALACEILDHTAHLDQGGEA